MLVNIFLGLIVCGLGSMLLRREKNSHLPSLLLLAIVSFLLANFYENWMIGYSDKFTYQWIQSAYYPVNINLYSTAQHYGIIFPFFIITVLSMLYNSLYHREENKLHLNASAAMSLAALILLICSENYIQLLVSACVIDIFGFYIINDAMSRRRYIFYNLLADAGLFMLFAIIWAYLHSIKLVDLAQYGRLGAHKDLVAILLLLCIFIKSGLFLFQTPMLDLQPLELNRINLISWLSTPVAGLVLLGKTAALLPISAYAVPLLQTIAAASVLWGLIGILIMDDIRLKSIYFNLIFYGFLYGLLSIGIELDNSRMGQLLVLMFLFGSCLLMITVASSNELYLSCMGGFIRNLKLSFLVTLIVVGAILQNLAQWYADGYIWWSVGFAAAFMLGSSYLLHQAYLGACRADERVRALLRDPNLIYGLTIGSVAGWIGWHSHYCSPALWYAGLAFVFLLLTNPLRGFRIFYDKEKLQQADYFSGFYDIFIISPIKILGRILWLTIDFLIIEKTIITFLDKTMRLLIALFAKLHTNSLRGYLFFLFVGTVMAAAACWLGGK